MRIHVTGAKFRLWRPHEERSAIRSPRPHPAGRDVGPDGSPQRWRARTPRGPLASSVLQRRSYTQIQPSIKCLGDHTSAAVPTPLVCMARVCQRRCPLRTAHNEARCWEARRRPGASCLPGGPCLKVVPSSRRMGSSRGPSQKKVQKDGPPLLLTL